MPTTKINIETFYGDFEKHVDLISAYTENPYISKIIKICRLKPYDLIFKKYNSTVRLHRHWIDEYGNSLFINKNKKIEIKLNDLNLNRKKIITTDLYENLSLNKISKISKLVFFLDGREEDFNSHHFILSFLGIDNFLRTFVCIYDEWVKYPPLYLGLDTLFSTVENINTKHYREIKSNKKVIYPCSEQKKYISFWEPSDEFRKILANYNLNKLLGI